MRRNMGRRNNNSGGGGGGPLLTGHLQDIDMELELLQRKRNLFQTNIFGGGDAHHY